MNKTDLEAVVAAKPDEQPVLPRTLGIRPMEYSKDGRQVFFSGVFGDTPDSPEKLDVWVATFYDRQEAEAFVQASKAFGQPTIGVRLTLAKPGDANGARVSGSPQAPGGG